LDDKTEVSDDLLENSVMSDHDYKLYLYKASNVVAGVGLVPIWYSIPFTELAAGKIVRQFYETQPLYFIKSTIRQNLSLC
jgi:hypothetical protein